MPARHFGPRHPSLTKTPASFQLRTGFSHTVTREALYKRQSDATLQSVHAVEPVQNGNDSVPHTGYAAPMVFEYKTNIVQLGEHFYFGHTDGIYKISDNGKKWELVIPAAKGKMFLLAAAGNVLYAIQTEHPC